MKKAGVSWNREYSYGGKGKLVLVVR